MKSASPGIGLRALSAALLVLWLSGTSSVVGADEGEPDLAAPEMESVYDPYQGMERNGRIPRIDKSIYVDHPDRWRYIPEGRIKPGNPLRRFLVSSFVVPLFFQSADVGTGFGAGMTDIDFRNQRRREFLGGFFSYTTEGQQSYVARWRRWLRHMDVSGGGVLQEERSYLRAGGGYRKTLTRRFYGIGPSTQERQETSFTDEIIFVDLGYSRSLEGALDDFVLEFGLLGEAHWLDRGRVSGVEGEIDVDPENDPVNPNNPLDPGTFTLFKEADEVALGWLSTSLRWDTRDSQRNPYRGTAIGASANAALAQTGGRVGALYRIFADQIFTLPPIFHDGGSEDEEHPPTDSLAFHFESQLSSGSLPFFSRPTLGGDQLLRGYIAGRWRDDAAWAAVSEYRFWVVPRGVTIWRHIRVERIGAALFYEVGGVAENGSGFFHERVRQSYGISGRATIERAALFRADLGFSEEGLNFSAGFGLAF
ncbi:MAG: hypothetical protein CL908_11020 [Deltaproteobacteria bacterium]|nr:hypothetical protein [Deltaproteobacteria bacterium]